MDLKRRDVVVLVVVGAVVVLIVCLLKGPAREGMGHGGGGGGHGGGGHFGGGHGGGGGGWGGRGGRRRGSFGSFGFPYSFGGGYDPAYWYDWPSWDFSYAVPEYVDTSDCSRGCQIGFVQCGSDPSVVDKATCTMNRDDCIKRACF